MEHVELEYLTLCKSNTYKKQPKEIITLNYDFDTDLIIKHT